MMRFVRPPTITAATDSVQPRRAFRPARLRASSKHTKKNIKPKKRESFPSELAFCLFVLGELLLNNVVAQVQDKVPSGLLDQVARCFFKKREAATSRFSGPSSSSLCWSAASSAGWSSWCAKRASASVCSFKLGFAGFFGFSSVEPEFSAYARSCLLARAML